MALSAASTGPMSAFVFASPRAKSPTRSGSLSLDDGLYMMKLTPSPVASGSCQTRKLDRWRKWLFGLGTTVVVSGSSATSPSRARTRATLAASWAS